MGLKDRVAQKGTRDHKRFNLVMGMAKSFGGKTALEVGPDDGTFAAGLIDLGYRVTSIGLDSPEKYAWEHHQLDLHDGCLDQTFDLVHCGQVLEHVRDPDLTLKNILAMARPDTLLIVTVPNFRDPGHLRTYKADQFFAWIGNYLRVHHRYTLTGNGRKCFGVAGSPN